MTDREKYYYFGISEAVLFILIALGPCNGYTAIDDSITKYLNIAYSDSCIEEVSYDLENQ